VANQAVTPAVTPVVTPVANLSDYMTDRVIVDSDAEGSVKSIDLPMVLEPLVESFWDSMVLLVTGGCGFIGSHFINHIASHHPNVRIINVDALYYCADTNNVNESVRSSARYILSHTNVCDIQSIGKILEGYKCTHLVHFAAQSHVQNSFDNSIEYTKDNVLGTHMLLEACRVYGKLQKIIHVSTDEVYGESIVAINEAHKTEQSVLCPTNPYAATKAGAELIAQSYIHSYKMPIIITRGNNVYGSNQYPEKLIPLFIKQLRGGNRVTVQGDGTQLRSFLHVTDTVRAFETILDKGLVGEIYNIGCDDWMEYSVMDVAKILIRLICKTDRYEDWIEYIVDRPFNDKRYLISNEKLKRLGWDVRVDFDTGIRQLCGS
jgi:dTDP-glucose 4,6-dehydratase/UDP-glucose 4,6-dehydratase